ncbi:Hsp20/alpha crystallin family protein [bacterium]|nr:Hsp20/alpha crystallin family protein [bacterium]
MRMWDAFEGLDVLRRELDRVFEDSGLPRAGKSMPRFAFLPGRAARGYPLVNLDENADAIVIEALAPGLDPESLEISVVGDQLTISGEKPGLGEKVQSESYHRSERSAGRFVRTIELPAAVNQNSAKAEYKNGLLLVTLPKAEEAKPKKIAVSVT